jgi:glutamate---cysteine ligase / carboxylate-amine ligase
MSTVADSRTLPDWAVWAPADAWTVGIEEEVMLLDPRDGSLASAIDTVLAAAGPDLEPHLSQETHGSAVELATDPHGHVPAAIDQLASLRDRLQSTLREVGLVAASAGTHPFASWQEVHVSAGERQQQVHSSMRELARREPTFALHVHVGVPDPEDAMRAMNRMRAHVPLLLALSANSPFWQGRDSGLASARVPLFGAFPRSGLPRAFASYGELVDTTDLLIRCGAFPEPTFLWWDVRLQPRYGTIEVRVMDAQTRMADTAALVALVQALVRIEAEDAEGLAPPSLVGAPEVLEENRFLALRDGVDARLLDPDRHGTIGVPDLLARTLEACAPVAARLGSIQALHGLEDLLAFPGPARQRAAARGPRGLITLVSDLTDAF